MPRRGPTTPQVRCHTYGLGWSPFARHYLGNHCLFSFPPGTKMFQFPGLTLCYGRVTVLQTAGLSHSEIRGSQVICTYPQLIAAYHVLHRLHEPRHPPCALSYFLYDTASVCRVTCVTGRTSAVRSYFQLYFVKFIVPRRHRCDVSRRIGLGEEIVFSFYSFVLCQYVNDLFRNLNEE